MKIPGYTIIRELGRGGMATVYLARQDRLTRDVALKVMKPIAMAGDDFTSRFVKEGQIIAQLQHPQIVTIYDFDSTDGYHYFSMEYLPGGTLADEIKRGLPVPRAIGITKKIAEALAVAHARGVIHRDVKPQNILFRADGTPVLTDFGIARATTRDPDSMQLTSYGMVIGSPRYMSPEQSTGQPLDPRADLYSLGVVFYEMLTHHLPYEADDVVSLAMKHCNDPIPRLPESLAGYQPVLDKLIAKKPEDRFASAGQLIRALDALEGAAGATTRGGDDATRLVARGDTSAPPPPAKTAPTGNRLVFVLVGAALIAAFGVYLALRVPQETTPIEILDRLPPGPSGRPETVVQYERLAIDHYRRKQLPQSLEIIRLGLAITPDDVRLVALKSLVETRIKAANLLGEARRLLAENELDAGAEKTEEGLKLIADHPDFLALRTELAERMSERGRLQAAHALELARTAQRAGDLDEAMRLARQALGQAPRDADLLALEAELTKALEREQDLAGMVQTIDGLITSGKLAESEEAIQRALGSYPDEPRLLDLREKARRMTLMKLDERVAQLREEAIAHFDQGEYQPSLDLIAEGLKLAPKDAGLTALRDKVASAQAQERQHQADDLLTRAQQAFDRGDLDGCRGLVEQGLALAPDHAGLTGLRKRILDRSQQERQIADLLRDCDAKFPPSAGGQRDVLGARDCYGRVLALDPARQEARERIAGLTKEVADRAFNRLSAYRLDDAEAALKELRAIAPDYPKLAGLSEDLRARREFFPAMIEVKGGCFQMGSPTAEAGREEDEGQHQVCVEDFRLAPFEVSVLEFKRFVQASGYRTDAEKGVGDMNGCEALDKSDKAHAWGARAWANWRKPNKYQATRDKDPVSCVSWNDTQAYIAWLSKETMHSFRLPSEAEWEYAARAGSTTARFWGDTADAAACQYANAADKGKGWDAGFPCGDGDEWAAPVGRFKPNPWGLFDMLGNVWEWTCSEYDAAYSGNERLCAPAAVDAPRVMRGGAWNSGPPLVRAAYRNRNFPESRYSYIGFRLALDSPAKDGKD